MQYAIFERALAEHALLTPNAIALKGNGSWLTYEDLQLEISQIRQELSLGRNIQPIAFAISNHPAWVVLDIAVLGCEMPSVPIPFFFTDSQILHAVIDAGAGTLITDQRGRFEQIFTDFIIRKMTLMIAGKRLMQFDLRVQRKELPQGTAKITYTSGTTGTPKGVCLSAESMLNVAESVIKATGIQGNANHLCVLPLSTLLENVAGVYAALIAGATIHVLPSQEVGLNGSQLDVQQLHSALTHTQANTAIFLPELLNALVSIIEAGASTLPNLRFLAVGGAAVASTLLTRASRIHLPVYQGYGLSECASVVSLNTLTANRIGSVGQPLPHLETKLAEDGEILVKGAHFLGYAGQASRPKQEWLATGDIGTIDEQGYIHIKGRKKNMFITSFGRNVSPEWVECALLNSPYIAQVCVYGEARPWNIALVVCKPGTPSKLINDSIEEINQQLPDYAQIKQWAPVSAFSSANQQLTLNGRLKRQAIYEAHQTTIDHLYKELA